tara:strand:- start:162 stop:1187 length:1026 start_codon:yes stop_codon:yes gene_type:complete
MSLKNLNAKKIPKLYKNKLRNNKINQLYKKFENSLNINENFLVAVSGGPDSLALAFFSKLYAIKHNLIVKYFIIDHKLRPESTKEAKLVKQTLKKFLIRAQILTWKGKKPTKNIQSAARKKRYDLLFSNCRKLKINNILLGHHLDDLFENFFIRILRGSGLKGLISFDKKTRNDEINLLRPLLDFKKNDLIFITKKIFGFYVKDPSNENEKFQRIRIRNLLNELFKNGFDKKKFILTINNLKYSNEIVKFYVKQNLRNNSLFFTKKEKMILKKRFFEQPHEVIFRSFSELIQILGQKYYSPRGKKLDKIISSIRNNTLNKVTLGGCIIEKINQTVILSKEY